MTYVIKTGYPDRRRFVVRRVDLEAAFERVLRPRVNRLMGEPGYHYRTRHSLAAFDAYAATLDWIRGQA